MEGDLRPMPRQPNPSMLHNKLDKPGRNPNREGQVFTLPYNTPPSSRESSPSSSPTPQQRAKLIPSCNPTPQSPAKGWSPRFLTQLNRLTKHKQIMYNLATDRDMRREEIPNLTEVDKPKPGTSSDVKPIDGENETKEEQAGKEWWLIGFFIWEACNGWLVFYRMSQEVMRTDLKLLFLLLISSDQTN